MPSIFDRIGGVFDRPGGLFGGSSFAPAAIMTGLGLLGANRNPRTNPGIMSILGQGVGMYSGLAEARWRFSSRQREEQERQRQEQARQRLVGAFGVPWQNPDTGEAVWTGGAGQELGLTPEVGSLLGNYLAAGGDPPNELWKRMLSQDTDYTTSNTNWFVVDGQPRLLPIEQGIEGQYPPYEPSGAAKAPKRYMKPLPNGKQQEMQWDAAAGAWVPTGEVVDRWQPKGTEGGLTLAQQRTNDEIDSARSGLANRGITPDKLRAGLGADEWSLVARDQMLSKLWTTAAERKYGDDPGYEETWWKYYPAQREGPAPGEVLGIEETPEPGIFERTRSSIFGPSALPPPQHPAGAIAEPAPPSAPLTGLFGEPVLGRPGDILGQQAPPPSALPPAAAAGPSILDPGAVQPGFGAPGGPSRIFGPSALPAPAPVGRNILDPGAVQPGFGAPGGPADIFGPQPQQPATPTMPTEAPPAPRNPQEREPGKVYRVPDGRLLLWNGQVWLEADQSLIAQ